MTNLTVIGCGYLGAVQAACMAHLGHDVVGIDPNASVVELLGAGKVPLLRTGIPGVAGRRTGRRAAELHL